MEKSIEWNVKVGKKVFLENFKKPEKIIALLTALACLLVIIIELIGVLENGVSIPKAVSFFILLLLLIFIAFYLYKTNKELFKDESRNYIVNSSGVTINGKLYPWSNYKYFQDLAQLTEYVSELLPTTISSQPMDRWLIQLLVSKFSDRNKLILVMDSEDIYKRVREIVKEKLEET